jgi:hypothetical protein
MGLFFVPYSGDKPVALNINGHRLVILSREKDSLEDGLGTIGAEKVKVMHSGNSQQEEAYFLTRLARTTNAGLVVTPGDVALGEVIKNLHMQLPWLQ